MRYPDAMVAKQRRKIWLVMLLAPLGLALTGRPESRAQYWAFNTVLPPRQNDPEKIWLARFQAAQQASSPQTPPITNTPDNDLYMRDYSYRSSYPGGESGRPVSSPTEGSPYGIAAAALPWNQVDFKDYDEPPLTPRDTSLVASQKYLLEACSLTGRLPAEVPEVAVLIAHLPEHAVLVVDGRRTRSRGPTRYLQSPPLTLGERYSYTIGVTWIEDGRWVSQSRKVAVRSGLIQAIYLRPAPALLAKKKREAQIEANLAKLNPEDREVARQQRICIIRNEVCLGENGVPIKVMLKNHRVFVCEESCVKLAQADPELNWAKAQVLRARGSNLLQEK